MIQLPVQRKYCIITDKMKYLNIRGKIYRSIVENENSKTKND